MCHTPGDLLDPRRPTQAAPGSPAKLAIMAARAALRLPLFLPGDAGGAQHWASPHTGPRAGTRPLPRGVTYDRRRVGQAKYLARAALAPGEKPVKIGRYRTAEEAAGAIRQALAGAGGLPV